ncbi:hypothetical protein ATZ33_12750 [Enterococcus silesiacus]|uniref:Adhesin domain-containing protein n=1 Tax=Enterococcus silesiacus TaxID=332949 RepID=A0A0S3KD73_9ENTE|nr:hypothetical protein [Enterococcus silesiacus]ALS02220.1 hypothetical protein ATZ33_12750 [Enterococcus silesiacus]OJG92422.1 hypothetical protein RV15_GL003215 [Enterococcus silesiacus]
MKKKIMILVAVLVTIGFFGYTSFAAGKPASQVDLSWELADSQIEKIALQGAEQEVKVVVNETSNEKTKISLSGKISEENEEFLKGTVKKENSLEIPLAKLNQFRLMTTANGKEPLLFTIDLGKDATYKSLEIDSVVGSVEAKIQAAFEGVYQLETNDQGEVKVVPETKESSKDQIKIDTMGDITVEK